MTAREPLETAVSKGSRRIRPLPGVMVSTGDQG